MHVDRSLHSQASLLAAHDTLDSRAEVSALIPPVQSGGVRLWSFLYADWCSWSWGPAPASNNSGVGPIAEQVITCLRAGPLAPDSPKCSPSTLPGPCKT